MWWASAELRRQQKERVKNKIKQTKTLERRGSQQGIICQKSNFIIIQFLTPLINTDPSSGSPTLIAEYDFSRPAYTECYDPFTTHVQTPMFHPGHYPPQYAPYEVDVRTERQTFVNDVPMRHDSSISTFSAMGPPQLNSTLPTFHGDEWLQEECFNQPEQYPPHLDSSVPQAFPPQPASLLQTANIPVDDMDRPLLEHFVDNVLRMMFPIVEVHQEGLARAKAILNSLETNKAYLHCCLSVSAIHLKNNVGLPADQIDPDIMRHRYEAISQLCQSLNTDSDHDQILESTLAMIFFHCSVGAPDDRLPDIPWTDHFQAATNLVNRLEMPAPAKKHNSQPPCVSPFSLSLTSWIDILGATMTGDTPQFAHNYRTRHLSGTSSGLRELMGCDDRIMYLISEIACLDSLKKDGRVNDYTICHHVAALGVQLEYTESADPSLDQPYAYNGTIRPEQLTKNMSAIFRLAARIYLCSLVPGFDRNEASVLALVSAITAALDFIPAGPYGFDRSLVWPLLMAGVHSTPESDFRRVLAERAAALGEMGDFGSFGRMFRVVQEIWRLSDDPAGSPGEAQPTNPSYPGYKEESPLSPGISPPGYQAIKKQTVSWRDIMQRNGWRYLLI